MNRFTALVFAIAFAGLIIGPPQMSSAQTGPCYTGPGLPCASQLDQTQQIAHEVTMIEKATTQIQTDESILTNAQSQLQQLQQAGQTLTSGQWNGINGLIGRIQQLNTISNDTAQMDSEIQQHFKSDYPTYTPNQSYASQFANWNASTTTAEAQALSVANATDATTPAINTQLQRIAATTPAGETQAIQQLSQVVIILTQQVNRLLDLQTSSMKSMSYYYQQKQAQATADCEQSYTQNPFIGIGMFATSNSSQVVTPASCH